MVENEWLKWLKLVDVIINTISLVDMELAGLGNSLPQMEIHCINFLKGLRNNLITNYSTIFVGQDIGQN